MTDGDIYPPTESTSKLLPRIPASSLTGGRVHISNTFDRHLFFFRTYMKKFKLALAPIGRAIITAGQLDICWFSSQVQSLVDR